jgi:CheY-like chemotaxis protein
MSDAEKRKMVLIVEDNVDIQEIYRTILLEHGYQVLTARQGAEGVHLARKHIPNLILMDLRMPVMDGWLAAWYLKTDPLTALIPICGISGFMSVEEARKQPHAENFDCILPRPTELSLVVATVEQMIGPPVPARSF